MKKLAYMLSSALVGMVSSGWSSDHGLLEQIWDDTRNFIFNHKHSDLAAHPDAIAYVDGKHEKKMALRAGKPAALDPLPNSIDLSAFLVDPLDQGNWGTCAGHSAVECLGASLNYRSFKTSLQSLLPVDAKLTASQIVDYARSNPWKLKIVKADPLAVDFSFRMGCWSDAVDEYKQAADKNAVRNDIFFRDEGTTITGIADGMRRGFLFNTDYAYTEEHFLNEPTADDYSKAKDVASGFRKKFTKIPETALGNLDPDAVMRALSQGRLVSYGMGVDSGFMSDLTAQTGVYQKQYGGSQGGHALTVVAYDRGATITVKGKKYMDSSGWVKVQNHWGAAWGDNGNFWMPFKIFNAIAFDGYTLELGYKTKQEISAIQASDVLND